MTPVTGDPCLQAACVLCVSMLRLNPFPLSPSFSLEESCATRYKQNNKNMRKNPVTKLGCVTFRAMFCVRDDVFE